MEIYRFWICISYCQLMMMIKPTMSLTHHFTNECKQAKWLPAFMTLSHISSPNVEYSKYSFGMTWPHTYIQHYFVIVGLLKEVFQKGNHENN